MISSYTLDVAYIDDSGDSGKRFILAVAAQSGESDTVTKMARTIAEWIKNKS